MYPRGNTEINKVVVCLLLLLLLLFFQPVIRRHPPSPRPGSRLPWVERSYATLFVACENIRFSSLFAAGDISRGTSPAAKRNGCFRRLRYLLSF